MKNLFKTFLILVIFTSIAFPQNLVITEIFAKAHNNLEFEADANHDGDFGKTGNDYTHISNDQFIEIINNSSENANISGYSIYSSEFPSDVFHTFPTNTILDPWEIIVIFGGGNPTGYFNNAIVQTCNGTNQLWNGNTSTHTFTIIHSDGISIINSTPYIHSTNHGSITRETIDAQFNANHQSLINLPYYNNHYQTNAPDYYNQLVASSTKNMAFSPGVFLSGDQSLAVELTSFDGLVVNGNVKLTWTTGSECNNRGFILERKENNLDWISIATYLNNSNLVGAGNTSESTKYQFIDTEIKSGNIYSYRLTDVDESGQRTTHYNKIITIESNQDLIEVEKFQISNIYPNPFNPTTTIEYIVKENQNVSISIYNIGGELVKTLVNTTKNTGNYSVVWNAAYTSSGVYFIHFQAGDFATIEKCILMK